MQKMSTNNTTKNTALKKAEKTAARKKVTICKKKTRKTIETEKKNQISN